MVDYSNLIMVQDGKPTRTPVPGFLVGLTPETLLDLTWTDPALGVTNTVWWPQESGDGPLQEGYKWGAETLKLDTKRKVVVVTHAQVRLTQAELDARRAEEIERMSPLIDQERDRRIDAGFTFNGKQYQTRQTDRENIAGAAQIAFMAIVGGAEAGNLRWADPDSDYVWIAMDNSLVTMDAQTVVDFGKAAAARKTQLIYAGRSLKNMQPIPDDYTDDKWWP